MIHFPRSIKHSNGYPFRTRVCCWNSTVLLVRSHFTVGQGRYYDQATWFARFHPEKIQSATASYVTEMFRVTGILELGLKRNGSGWLVGEKCTYADLSFRTWASVGKGLLRELGKLDGLAEQYPLYTAWLERMDGLEGVKRISAAMAKGRAEHGLK